MTYFTTHRENKTQFTSLRARHTAVYGLFTVTGAVAGHGQVRWSALLILKDTGTCRCGVSLASISLNPTSRNHCARGVDLEVPSCQVRTLPWYRRNNGRDTTLTCFKTSNVPNTHKLHDVQKTIFLRLGYSSETIRS